MNTTKEVLELITLAGKILLHNGAEIFRVQETMIRIAKAYHIEDFEVYVISNGIFATVNKPEGNFCTTIKHIPLAPVHLGRVAAVNQLSREIEQGIYTLEEAREALEQAKVLPYTKEKFQVLCSGIGSASFCYIFGGNIKDSMTAFLSGALLYIFLLYVGKQKMSKIMTNILASGLVTLVGLLLFNLGMGDNMDKIIIGSIIPLVPGVPLTSAIRDFFNSDYLSGTIRLIDALLIAFCIAIGVGVILKLWSSIGGMI